MFCSNCREYQSDAARNGARVSQKPRSVIFMSLAIYKMLTWIKNSQRRTLGNRQMIKGLHSDPIHKLSINTTAIYVISTSQIYFRFSHSCHNLNLMRVIYKDEFALYVSCCQRYWIFSDYYVHCMCLAVNFIEHSLARQCVLYVPRCQFINYSLTQIVVA